MKGIMYKRGLVLSGGAARGFAHIGIIHALDEHNFCPDVISGVSAGSIVGAFYADGFHPMEILELFKKRKMLEFIKLSTPNTGLFKMDRLKRLLRSNLRSSKIEQLKQKFIIAATNYQTGSTDFFDKGSLIDAIIASSSIPILFKPYKIGNFHYIDGGITDNFPIDPLIGKCEYIVGAYINPIGPSKSPKGLINTALRAIYLSAASKAVYKKEKVDLFIEPYNLKDFSFLGVSKGDKMFAIGYEEAKKILKNKNFAIDE